MDDSVKEARPTKKATAKEETGQKAAELLLAVLEELKASRAELKASREESEALRKLLAQVFTTLTRPEENEESFAQDRHVEATPPMMKKSRMGEDALTQRSARLSAASQSQD
jgi:hypothetical protein